MDRAGAMAPWEDGTGMRRERQAAASGQGGGGRSGSRSGGRSGGPRTEPPRWRRWLRRLIVWTIGLGLLLAIGVATAVGLAAQRLPDFEGLKASPVGQTIRVRAADGTVFLTLGPNYGRWLPLAEVPAVMQDAMVAIEDRRFRSHIGIDPIGLARAAKFAVETRGTGRRLQGASTISQQLARNVFLSTSYTARRKLNEAVLAMALEWKFSKDQILELYLNKVYFGGGSYGIDAASNTFFGHSATQLTLAEAAVIAGLVRAPSRYAPTADPAAALARSKVVLAVMVETGDITAAEAANARPAEVELARESGQNSARYFTDWALPQLDVLIDEGTAALDVWTTVDLGMQRAATAAIRANTPAGAQGALVAIDRDGAVRAMVGGTDYVASNYNRATLAVRQPGSAWKLFVYMAALEAGYQVGDEVVDEPVTINGWSPRNSNGRFAGAMNLRTAFANSVNTVAAKLGDDIGFSAVTNMARRLGITTPMNTQPSMVLGTAETRVIDMTAAYAAVARRGVAIPPFAIVKVATTEGVLLYEHKPPPGAKQVDDWVAAGITDMLQSAVAAGTGRAAQIGRPVAGKTGTTSSNKDGWFLGFSSGLTTGVWMGRDDARAVGGLQGGRAPASAFADFMRGAVAKRPVEAFDTEVTLPDWLMEDDEAAYLGDAEALADPGLDEPLPAAADPVLDDGWIDQQTGAAPPPNTPVPAGPAQPPPPQEEQQ